MKRKMLIGIAVVAVLVGVIAACWIFRPAKAAQIAIVETNWSGEKDYEPTEQTITYEVKPGDVIQCGGMADFEVTILKISNDSVTIETNMPMSSAQAPYVNLKTDETHFTISKNESLRLVTPTLDAGDIYTFSILETGKER